MGAHDYGTANWSDLLLDITNIIEDHDILFKYNLPK